MSSIKLTADSGGGTFEIKAPSSSANTRVLTLPDSGDYILGGKILQVKQTVKTDVSTLSIATTALSSDIMTVSITPQSTSSKILLQCSFCTSCSTTSVGFVFQRDSTDIGIADAAGNRQRRTSAQTCPADTVVNINGTFLDSPSTTSAITYRVKACHTSNSTQTIVVNNNNSGDVAKFINTICSLTAMEVAG